MAFVPKKRKDTWTLDHDDINNNDQTNPYVLTRKDSSKSVIPSDDHAQYVFHRSTASSFDGIGKK
jgi:hypothetical protein